VKGDRLNPPNHTPEYKVMYKVTHEKKLGVRVVGWWVFTLYKSSLE